MWYKFQHTVTDSSTILQACLYELFGLHQFQVFYEPLNVYRADKKRSARVHDAHQAVLIRVHPSYVSE